MNKHSQEQSKMTSTVSGTTQRFIILMAAALPLLGMGCGVAKSPDVQNVHSSSLPPMPTPMPGEASVSGKVLDADGTAVSGATIKVAETDRTATSDATGVYQMMVPSDSTVTLVTSAPGFAPTFRESVLIASQAMVTGFDVLVLPLATIARMNALGAPDQTATRGLVAVRLHSLNDACLTAGAHVSVWPPKAATVIYSSPNPSGGLDEADPSLDSVQAGGHVDLWLSAAFPPGNMLLITVEQAGCQLLTPSPSMAGVIFPGSRRIDVQSLTQADLFLN
jgi:Carboxypeptidase regulatory-like domain